MRLLFYMLKLINKKIETSSSLIGYTLSILCCSKTSTQYTEDASQPLTLGEKHSKTVFVPTVEKNEKVVKHLLTSVYHGVVDPDEIFAWPFEQLDEEQALYTNSRGEEGKSYELEDLERNLITQGDGLMHDHLINVAELGQKFAMVSTLDNKSIKRSSFKSFLISSPKLPPKKEKASIFGSLFSLGNIFSSRAQTPDEQFIETLNKQDPGIMQGLKENVAYIIKSTESPATVKQFLEELAINSPNLPMRQYYKTLQGEAFHFQPHSIPDQSGHWQTNPFNQAFLSAIIVDEGPLRNLIVSWWKSLLAHELPHISNCKKFKFEPVYNNRSYYMFLDDVVTFAPATPSVPQTQFRSFADFCLFHMIQWMRGAPVATQTNKQVQEGPEANTKIAYYQVIELIFKHKANADTAIDKKIFDKLAQSVFGEANILAKAASSSDTDLSQLFTLCSGSEISGSGDGQANKGTKKVVRVGGADPLHDLFAHKHQSAASLLYIESQQTEWSLINLVLLRKLIASHIWSHIRSQNSRAGPLPEFKPLEILNMVVSSRSTSISKDSVVDCRFGRKVMASINCGQEQEYTLVDDPDYLVLAQACPTGEKVYRAVFADHFIHYSFNQQEQSILVTHLPPNYQPNMEKQQLVLRGQDQLDTVRIITILSDKKRRLAAVFGSVLKDQLNDLTEQIMFLLSAGN